MTDSRTKSALLGAAGQKATPIPWRSVMEAELCDALSRAAGRLLQKSLTATVSSVERLTQSAVIDALDPQAMTVTLLARGTQPIGMLSLSPPLVAQLALAMSGANGAPDAARRLSRVDQSLARMLVLRVLDCLQSALAARGAKAEIEGLRSGTVDTARHSLQASLQQGNYAAYNLHFPLDGEAEDHTVSFYFTYDFCTALSMAKPVASAADTGAEARRWRAHMQRVALAAPVESLCVLDRFDLTTGEIARLKRGDILPLPGLGLNDIVLELPHQNGPLEFARGKLGAFRRSKALKLITKLASQDAEKPLVLTDQSKDIAP